MSTPFDRLSKESLIKLAQRQAAHIRKLDAHIQSQQSKIDDLMAALGHPGRILHVYTGGLDEESKDRLELLLGQIQQVGR